MSAAGPARRGGPVLLGFDCSGGACSAAILAGGDTLARRSEPMAQGHGERLLSLLRETLAAAGLGFAALDAIAVTVGPGRFTGLRVGIAAARGLALALGRPALGIASFAAIAEAARRERPGRPMLAVIDSGREELFAQGVEAEGRPAGPPRIATARALAAELAGRAMLLAGDGARLVARALAERGTAIELVAAGPIPPEAVAALGLAELRGLAPGVQPPAPRPIYLRAPDARLPGNAS
jgi:tRNA threonylcarbamoyladenosine biosynthesis protein TsaB